MRIRTAFIPALAALSAMSVLALGCETEEPAEPRAVEIADFCEQVGTAVKAEQLFTAELAPGEIVDYGDAEMYECSEEDFQAYLDAGGAGEIEGAEFRYDSSGRKMCLHPLFDCCPLGYAPMKTESFWTGWVCHHPSPFVPDIDIVNW